CGTTINQVGVILGILGALGALGALGHPRSRCGTTINQLRRETGAEIAVREAEEGEDPEEGALVQIWGSPACACRAKAAVLSLVAQCAPVAEELRVPGRAVGRII
ncbi:tudor and KH domain-containing protein-like, partial [Corapipo altera]|uniref:tudor and KH domain-containing protein-like n=1 Tax=Corapipo altera TaxID=415028 RepID=UPI000FD6925F